jgi:ribosome-associated protein
MPRNLYDEAMRDASAMDDADGLDLGHGVIIPLSEVELRTSRSSGPGGQHANVTDSRVEAVFDVEASKAFGDAERARLLERLGPRVSAVAQDARGQLRNRELALERLRAKLAAALRVPRPRRPTKPTVASRERRLSGKRAGAQRKAARRPPQPEE